MSFLKTWWTIYFTQKAISWVDNFLYSCHHARSDWKYWHNIVTENDGNHWILQVPESWDGGDMGVGVGGGGSGGMFLQKMSKREGGLQSLRALKRDNQSCANGQLTKIESGYRCRFIAWFDSWVFFGTFSSSWSWFSCVVKYRKVKLSTNKKAHLDF